MPATDARPRRRSRLPDAEGGSAAVTREALDAVLNLLGGDAEEVAGTLLALGCRGFGGTPRACPVARYLGRAFPGTEILVCVGSSVVGGREFRLPGPVADFVAEFDEGRHPALVFGGVLPPSPALTP